MDVEGIQELLGKLDQLSLAVSKKLVARAARAGAQVIEERAAELAPDDPETSGSRVAIGMMTTVTQQTANEAIAKVGTRRGAAFVGKFAEWGTSRQKAQPFLRPAFDERADEALDAMGESLAEGIAAEVGR
jgi:HK97 gp10 family phage protein